MNLFVAFIIDGPRRPASPRIRSWLSGTNMSCAASRVRTAAETRLQTLGGSVRCSCDAMSAALTDLGFAATRCLLTTSPLSAWFGNGRISPISPRNRYSMSGTNAFYFAARSPHKNNPKPKSAGSNRHAVLGVRCALSGTDETWRCCHSSRLDPHEDRRNVHVFFRVNHLCLPQRRLHGSAPPSSRGACPMRRQRVTERIPVPA